jgi:hypothetical protein
VTRSNKPSFMTLLRLQEHCSDAWNPHFALTFNALRI